MEIKIFTQPKCPNCQAAKEFGKEMEQKGIKTNYFDVTTPDGLAESLMHNVLSTPSIIILKNNEVVEEFLGTTPLIKEAEKWL